MTKKPAKATRPQINFDADDVEAYLHLESHERAQLLHSKMTRQQLADFLTAALDAVVRLDGNRQALEADIADKAETIKICYRTINAAEAALEAERTNMRELRAERDEEVARWQKSLRQMHEMIGEFQTKNDKLKKQIQAAVKARDAHQSLVASMAVAAGADMRLLKLGVVDISLRE